MRPRPRYSGTSVFGRGCAAVSRGRHMGRRTWTSTQQEPGGPPGDGAAGSTGHRVGEQEPRTPRHERRI
eukprot:13325890-Alexandrium_andersonii.AAC.1